MRARFTKPDDNIKYLSFKAGDILTGARQDVMPN